MKDMTVGMDEREKRLGIYHPYVLENVLQGYCGYSRIFLS